MSVIKNYRCDFCEQQINGKPITGLRIPSGGYKTPPLGNYKPVAYFVIKFELEEDQHICKQCIAEKLNLAIHEIHEMRT